MKIKFDNINEDVIPNFRGGEKEFHIRIFRDEDNKILKGRLEPGASIGTHAHENESETMFIVSGNGKHMLNGKWESFQAGDCLYCPNGQEHSMVNDGKEDLIFFAVVPSHS